MSERALEPQRTTAVPAVAALHAKGPPGRADSGRPSLERDAFGPCVDPVAPPFQLSAPAAQHLSSSHAKEDGLGGP